MSNRNTITLVVVCDEHYMILLAALVKSIEENLSKDIAIDLWIIDDGIKSGNRKKLQASVDAAVTTLHWVRFEELIKDTRLPKDLSSYPQNIYARLFIPHFLPANVEKALYLDVDMIVLADLYRLWNTDITNYYMAAVQDPRIKTFDNDWGGILNYKALNLQAKSKYFNTGLLLINVRKWREDRITGKVFDTINDNIKYANYPDQYGLNIVVADQWLPLDSSWNAFVDDEKVKPDIIHFVGRKPIYKAYKYREDYRQLFYKYLKNTAWRNARPITEYNRYIKKIRNVLLKIIQGKRK